jgi:hypothetical protein
MRNSKLKPKSSTGKPAPQKFSPAIQDSINFYNKKIDAISQGSFVPKSKEKEFNKYLGGLARQYKKAGVPSPIKTVAKAKK